MNRLALALALALVPACGTSTTATSDAGSDASAASDSGLDAAASDAAAGDDAGVQCSGHDATQFPTFDRSCSLASDCTIGAHQTDCCGSIDAMGIARSESARFATAESQCEMQYPACGCDSGTVTTDDGSSPPPGSGTSAVVVDCVAGTCTTRARAASACDGATCSPSQVCVMECSGIALDGGTLASHCVDVPPACAGSTDCSCFGTTDPCPTGSCVSVDHGAPVCLCA